MNSYKKVMNVIYIPFSGVGLFDDPNDDEWLAYRIQVFKDYTLKSILNQSKKPDILWLSFDGRRGNPLIAGLHLELNRVINTIITYDGLIYLDDKFIIRLWKNCRYASTWSYAWRMFGRAIKQWDLRIFARFIGKLFFKNALLAKRLDKSLKIVRKALNSCNYICLTRMDSDDMLHRDFIWELAFYESRYQRAIVRNRGHLYDARTNGLAEWNPTTCPQFFSLFIPNNIFSGGKVFKEYWNGYRSHEDANKVFDAIQGDDYRYLMLIHRNQISSTWNHPFRGRTIEDKLILKDYGL